MTNKQTVKPDQVKEKTEKDDTQMLGAEVIEDLDLPNEDEDAIRGGCRLTGPSCAITYGF